MYKFLTSIITFSFLCTSCCSISRHPTQKVLVTSSPHNANLIIDGYDCGTTPTFVHLDKKYDHHLIVSKEGYDPQETYLQSRHTWKSASNLGLPLLGAAIGTGVGLAMFGTGGFILPYFISGTAIGGIAGLALGGAGTIFDISSRSDCDLHSNKTHFQLVENH